MRALSRSQGDDAALVVPAFFLKVLAVDGLDSVCSMPAPRASRQATWCLRLLEGGVLCRDCRRGRPMTPEALSILREHARRWSRERPHRARGPPRERGDRAHDRGDGVALGPLAEKRPGSTRALADASRSQPAGQQQDVKAMAFGFYVHVPFCASAMRLLRVRHLDTTAIT